MSDVSSDAPAAKKNGQATKAPADAVDVARELSGLRREVLEARNLVIRTDNLLKTFHLELKSLSTKQQAFERLHFIGHVAAYVVIGLLAAGGALMTARLVGEQSRAEAERLLAEARQAQARAQTAEEEAAALVARRAAAVDEARAVYEMLLATARPVQEQGLARLEALDPNDLEPFSRGVLERVAGDLRRDLAAEAYGAGMALYRRGQLRAAVDELGKYRRLVKGLPAEWQAEQRSLASYYLGAAYNQLGQHAAAVGELEAYLGSTPSGETAAYGSLLLGDSLQATGRTAEARRAFEAGLRYAADGRTGRALRERLQAPPPG